MSEQAMQANRFSVAIAGLVGTGLMAGGMGVLADDGPAVAISVADVSCHARLPAGDIHRLRLASDRRFRYLAYRPASAPPGAPILVSVHGISRNAREHMRMLIPLADRYGVVLLAPRFPRERFPGYQRLLPDAAGRQPDELLRQAADELAALSGADAQRLYLFGYSGGAQFVHRFAMRWPQRVARYALGAAGWYTFPDLQHRFPYGLKQNRRLGLGGFDAEAFLHLPALVLVGERDVRADSALRASSKVSRLQGETRLERGMNWVAAVNEAAESRGLAPPASFDVLARSPHSFARSMKRGAMGEKVFRHLFGAPPG